MRVWRTLSAQDRATARRRFLPWLTLLRKQKKSHTPAPSTYLSERLWEAVPDPAEAPPETDEPMPHSAGQSWPQFAPPEELPEQASRSRVLRYVAGAVPRQGKST